MNSASACYSSHHSLCDRQTAATCRIPVLVFYSSAIFWLVVAMLFGAIVSCQFLFPNFLSQISFTTFGRMFPASVNALLYGWAFNASLGTTVWLVSTLSKKTAPSTGWPTAVAAVWNIGVAVGVIGILEGKGNSMVGLEFPIAAAALLFVAFTMLAFWATHILFEKETDSSGLSIRYLLAGFFCFPWTYSTVQILIHLYPVYGAMQIIAHAWFLQNLIWLWFTPVALALLYYLLPLRVGRPIYSFSLASLGFSTLVAFVPWTGMQKLAGGPVPVWIVTLGIVGNILMLIPIGAISLSLHKTVHAQMEMCKKDPVLSFLVFGATAFTVTSLLGTLMSLRSLNHLVQFTYYSFSYLHLMIYAFVSMVLFGSIYYIMPRLLGVHRPARCVRLHFWCSAVGTCIVAFSLAIGGFFQGLALDDPKIPFTAVINYTQPFFWLRVAGGACLLVAHLAFISAFIKMLLRAWFPKVLPSSSCSTSWTTPLAKGIA